VSSPLTVKLGPHQRLATSFCPRRLGR